MNQAEPTPSPEKTAHLPMTVAAVRWTNVLEFVHLFRGFQLAINPIKMMVALGAILAIYFSGRAFDMAWGPQAYTGEIETFQTAKTQLYQWSRAQRLEGRKSELFELLVAAADYQQPSLSYDDKDYYTKHPAAALRKLGALYTAHFHDALAKASNERRESERLTSTDPLGSLRQSPAETEVAARRQASSELLSRMTQARNIVGTGIFDALLAYEIRQFNALCENTLSLVRLTPARSRAPAAATGDLSSRDDQALAIGVLSTSPDRMWRSDTIAGCLANMTITAPCWLFSAAAPMQWRPADSTGSFNSVKIIAYRGFYLGNVLVLVAFWFAIIALAGSILCRLSALEFCGYEKPSFTEVVRFARQRFWQFIQAPLMPFGILAGMGVVLTLLGLLGAIPFLGELIIGFAFIIFLIISFIMTLLILAIMGGFGLLYPALAVEGSDSFDAVSRSFSYVYARPWRVLAYNIISLLYGTITFLFVAFTIYLVLALTHYFVGMGTNFFGYNSGWYSGVPKLDTLWAVPDFNRLVGPINWWAMSWTEYGGAIGLYFWIFLLISTLGAYVISFFASSQTIIYALLRRSVDGPSLTEIYFPDTPPTSPSASPSSSPTASPTSPLSPPPPPSPPPPSGPEPTTPLP